ncbi:aldose 1-epimerase family protein [Lacticaseibacillus hulanensis]|uniref:aldose 1-epimerase family protein n=1 Tax=Lacticaseibacillus hulanensis TaxID=2493111 RepID=UPI000FD9FF41|nr:aldose 1-epimerase family protein [Lacticaseibacillus hulanensis]
MVKIENEFLKAEINLHGAELASLISKEDGTEYMWQADPKVWARHAPVLFPIVGALKDDKYTVDGQTYHMTRHGFARDMDFTVVNQTANFVQLELRDNEATHAKYPYAFRLVLTYNLTGKNLAVGYHVENPAKEEMYFSIGAHPAFRIPLEDGLQFDDYSFKFSPEAERTRVGLDGKYADFAAGKTVNENELPLSLDLFKDDALIYVLDGKQTDMTLSTPKDSHGVRLSVTGAPYVGIWSNYPTPGAFCCIEPWWGVADEPTSDGNFKTKRGINKLGARENFDAGFTIGTF